MLRICAPLFVAALLAGAGPLAAEETPGGQPIVAVVTGLANGDLLNIRASASPVGTVKGRLPNGATLSNYGCGEVNGHKWCKVADTADTSLSGWAPARYLYMNPDEVVAQLPPEATAVAAAPAALPAAGTQAAAVAAGTPLPAVAVPATETPAAPSGQDAAVTSEALAAMVANKAPAAEAPPEQVAAATPAAEPARPFEIGAPAAARADTPVAERKPTAPAQPQLPPDLTARLGGDAGPASTPADQQAAAAAIGKTAILDAYGLAFAARGKAAAEAADGTAGATGAAPAIETAAPPAPDIAPATAEASLAAVPAEATPPPTADTASSPAAEADPLPAAAPLPLPAPRPEIAAEPLLDTQTVAQVRAPAPEAPGPPVAAEPAVVVPASVEPAGAAPLAPTARVDATGEIPCARYLGQPMTRCHVSIARKGDTIADVTVTWPDGGMRVISFYAGEPAGSNSRSAFRFTREGGLNMIRVGAAERFEITDALAFGD